MIFLQDLIEELEKASETGRDRKDQGGLDNPSALSEFLEIVKVSGAKAINKAEESSKVKIDRDQSSHSSKDLSGPPNISRLLNWLSVKG